MHHPSISADLIAEHGLTCLYLTQRVPDALVVAQQVDQSRLQAGVQQPARRCLESDLVASVDYWREALVRSGLA